MPYPSPFCLEPSRELTIPFASCNTWDSESCALSVHHSRSDPVYEDPVTPRMSLRNLFMLLIFHVTAWSGNGYLLYLVPPPMSEMAERASPKFTRAESHSWPIPAATLRNEDTVSCLPGEHRRPDSVGRGISEPDPNLRGRVVVAEPCSGVGGGEMSSLSPPGCLPSPFPLVVLKKADSAPQLGRLLKLILLFEAQVSWSWVYEGGITGHKLSSSMWRGQRKDVLLTCHYHQWKQRC